jgi:glycosyltransferase involved in cell wall biosynthesis
MAEPRPLDIAQVTATFPPYFAGTGNVCFEQSRALAARGHRVQVYTATYPGTPQDPPGVRVHRLRPLLRIGLAPLLAGLLRMPRPDVVHVHQPFIFGAELAVLRAAWGGVPVVSTFHNELRGPGVKGALFRAYAASAGRVALRRSARLTVLSIDHARSVPPLAAELDRRPGAFVEVPNGVDAAVFVPDGDRPDGPPTAVFAAQLDGAHRFKRLDLLLSALGEVPGLRLRVIGGGELLEGFRAQAAAGGVSDRVEFLGARPHAELPALLRSGDFLVICSDSTEAFPLVQLEALASGVPVVASALPGVRTVVTPGRDGLHVVPGDRASLVEALRSMAAAGRSSVAAMGRSGREKVLERYTWERSAETLERVYREVVDR